MDRKLVLLLFEQKLPTPLDDENILSTIEDPCFTDKFLFRSDLTEEEVIMR